MLISSQYALWSILQDCTVLSRRNHTWLSVKRILPSMPVKSCKNHCHSHRNNDINALASNLAIWQYLLTWRKRRHKFFSFLIIWVFRTSFCDQLKLHNFLTFLKAYRIQDMNIVYLKSGTNHCGSCFAHPNPSQQCLLRIPQSPHVLNWRSCESLALMN